MDKDKYEIVFVNDFATPLLSAAYDAVSAFENLTAKRLDGLEVIRHFSSKPHKRTSFVLCRFEGECFEHLRSLGAAIYGPQIILHYVRENKALPKVSYPLFSTALMGAIATVTSVTGSEREYLLKSIEMLHGHASRDLFDGVNVVITPKVGSKKYLVGASRGLHILLPSWIKEAWRLSAIQDPIDMMLPVYTERFRVPIFSQLVICVSGLSAEERKEVSDLVLKHGGRYSGMMKIGETTHLIVKQAAGLKYSHAKKWKIQIVSVRWLVDSVSKGYAMDEEEYRVPENKENCSTPTYKVNGCSLSFDNISVISHANNTTARVDETTTEYLHAESFIKPKPPISLLSILSDCIVAFKDCSVNEVVTYSKLVSELGGRLCTKLHDQVSESLTHVVVGSLNTSAVANMEQGIYYVRGSWLISCKQACRHVDEAAHLVFTSECSGTNSVSTRSEEITKQTLDTEDMGLINQYFGAGGLADLDDFTSGAGDTTAVPAPAHGPENNPSFSSLVNTISPLCTSGIFSGLRFFLHEEFSVDTKQSLSKSISSSGGRVLFSSMEVDYIVAPFFVMSLPTAASSCRFVTQHWIEHCISVSSIQLNDLTTERAFTPCIRSGPPPLLGCVISLSGFVGRDRSLLTSYSQALGAVTQECFLRKAIPSRDLAASTHLIAAKPDGRKWPAALQWGIPAVNRSWLYACAESWSRLDESQFPVRSVPEGCFSLSISKADSLGGSNVTPVAKPPQKILPTPSNSDPQKCVVKSLDDALHTPDWVCAKNCENILGDTYCDSVARILEPSPPLSEQVARCLKKAVHKTASLPKRKLDLSDDERETLPLRNVTICVSKHLSGRQVELNGIAKKLGGDFKWIYDKQVCTHVIAEYRPGAKADESGPTVSSSNSAVQHVLYHDVALAERDAKYIVHPDWLSACLRASRRLPESDFPVLETFPHKELETSAETDQPAPKVPRTESSDLLGGVNRRLELMLNCSPKPIPGICSFAPVSEVTSTEILNLPNEKPTSDTIGPTEHEESVSFMKTMATSGPRRLRRNPRHVSGVVGSSLTVDPGGKAVFSESADPSSVSQGAPDRVNPVQSLMVRWQYDDAAPLSPADTGASSASTGHADPPHSVLRNPIPTTTGTATGDPVNHSDAPSANPMTIELPDTSAAQFDDPEKPKDPEPSRRYVVSFSGLAPDARDHYANVVNQLGGEVDNQLTISDETTHLIVHTPTRSEKYLICLATGKWILHKSYLDACLRESRWVDESNFEWGGPGTEPLLMQLSPSPLVSGPNDNRPQQSAQIRDLAKAARHWRLAGGNAFQNWKVIFGPGCDKEMSFRRVIEAGGGKVLASGPPYPPASLVTHSFYKRRPNVAITPSQFPSEYQWLRIDYLSAYLTTGHDVSRQEFALETV
ncbi:unnamed protein product [Dicrocoelium dendriticum]|nr:unnamed protein product [Dicrocoelium dendriticum]